MAADCEVVYGSDVPLPDTGSGAGTQTTPATGVTTPATSVSVPVCQARLLRVPRSRKANVAGVGRVTLSVVRVSRARIRFGFNAVTRSLAPKNIKLDGRRLKLNGRRPQVGRVRLLTRTVLLRSLRPGRHTVKATLMPLDGTPRTLRMVLDVVGC
jgi:hypothetical protein